MRDRDIGEGWLVDAIEGVIYALFDAFAWVVLSPSHLGIFLLVIAPIAGVTFMIVKTALASKSDSSSE